jgi:hypothetical protein
MSRLAAFRAELLAQLTWVGTAREKAQRIGTQVPLVILALLGIPASQAGITDWARPWLPYFTAPFLLYLTWKAAVAWDRTRGPSVEVGPVVLDDEHGIFDVTVTNGPVGAYIDVQIVSVRDASGRDRIEHPWQGHWRGRPTAFDGWVEGGKPARYGLISVRTLPSRNPTLEIFTRDDSHGRGEKVGNDGHSLIPLIADRPLAEQGALTITVHVDCFRMPDGKTERGRTVPFSFRVVPDSDSPTLPYKVIQGA